MEDFLRKCQEAYDVGSPIISDEEFDYLARKYKFKEVGAKHPTNKIKHLHRMYSLKNVFAEEDNSVEELFDTLITSPKLDGAAIELVYNEGHLISASTRGDGVEGEDIWANARLLRGVPNTIPISDHIQVTGEVVAPKTTKNARNYAAGAIRLKDVDEFKSRDIRFIAYGVYPYLEESYGMDMHRLTKLGFDTVISSDWEEYPQDGIVYRENSNSKFDELGYTDKYPRGAVAYKKRSDVAIEKTTLLDVIWQVGKQGQITPVAIFEPVEVEGATISRATLHNAGIVESLDLNIGDTILVTKGGGVIPKVIGKA